MELRPGLRLRSAVCDTEIVVVRAPSTTVILACGGVPLLAAGEPPPAGAELDPKLAGGALIGKRYVNEEHGVEVLCTKGGEGMLTCEGSPLMMQLAKPLPSSD